MSASYLIRLDDACPTMKSSRWRIIEDLLDEFSIKPIVAVVPNNRDPKLVCEEADQEFWQRVSKWQTKGWEVALHGYTHELRPTNVKQVLPFYSRSEFSGLSYDEQNARLQSGLRIFESHGLSPRTFVAPSHCFDDVTVRVLAEQTSIHVISDGIALNCYRRDGLVWIPQQLSQFSPKTFGVWTVCLHPNTCSDEGIDGLRIGVRQYRDHFVSVDDLLKSRIVRRRSMLDRVFAVRFWHKRNRALAIQEKRRR